KDALRTWVYTGDNEDAQTLFRNVGFDTVPKVELQDRFIFVLAMYQYLEQDAKLLLSKSMKVEDLLAPTKYLDRVVDYCKTLTDGVEMLREKLGKSAPSAVGGRSFTDTLISLAEVEYGEDREYEDYGANEDYREDGEDGEYEDEQYRANEKDGEAGEVGEAGEYGEDGAYGKGGGNRGDADYEEVGEEQANEFGEDRGNRGEDRGNRREDMGEDMGEDEGDEVGEKDGEDGEGEEVGANEDGEYREDGEYEDAEDREYEDAEDGEYEDAEDGEYEDAEDTEDGEYKDAEDGEVRSLSWCLKRKQLDDSDGGANPKPGRDKRCRKGTPKRVRKLKKIQSGEIGAHVLNAKVGGVGDVEVLTYLDTSFDFIIERPSKESIKQILETYFGRLHERAAVSVSLERYRVQQSLDGRLCHSSGLSGWKSRV
ncbi:hypothetical protein HK102_010507, partial [Quaeritorhiza haematococci]